MRDNWNVINALSETALCALLWTFSVVGFIEGSYVFAAIATWGFVLSCFPPFKRWLMVVLTSKQVVELLEESELHNGE